jgi:trimethyllysine dioxygenase
LVDGFHVAAEIRERDLDAYHLLSTVPIPAHAAGEQDALYRPGAKFPVLNHNMTTGELTQVRWNNDDRSTMKHLLPSVVEAWYSIF